ncbi:MAG: adenylyltransferase/cytidyltransferase family protein [Chlamydiia bacterium]|nr:adenylyltransferase/cytidyltransferase family protein [Chlamydiia bacterium]
MSQFTWEKAHQTKVILPEELESKMSDVKRQGFKLATLNGSFDLMHAGHLEIIYQASQVADKLLVLLNSDTSIQQYKGKDRPLISLKYRIRMMAALGFVDFVSWFDETDPIQVLSKVKPDVHVNGAEYGSDCIEADCVKKNGGRIEIIQLVPGLSTSEIIKKIESNASSRRN